MSREYYSIKDIILGLRSEYLNLENDLGVLRQCCCTVDRNVDDFKFCLKTDNQYRSVTRNEDEKGFIYFYGNDVTDNSVGIICRFEQNIVTIRGILLYIQEKLRMDSFVARNGICLQDNDGNYFIKNDDYWAFIRNDREFSQYMDKIMKSDFAKRMKFGAICQGREVDYLWYSLIIFERFIKFNYTLSNNRNVGSCRYDVDDDLIKFDIGRKSNLSLDDMIMGGLNFKVPAKVLCEYQRDLIDNNPIIYKDMDIVLNDDSVSKISLAIEEYNDKVILRKVRVKDRGKY